jgi:ABC-type protease/lipase transport system fused ATPase/permease subunit
VFAANPPVETEKTDLPALTGAVSVKNLVCMMPDQPNPLLAGVDFALSPGDGLGIIGPSGAGKTTLAKALLGIWPHLRGEVRLDGATHDQWDRDKLGRHIGYLPQEVVLLPGSLVSNIARFDPDVSAEKVIQAAQLAGIHQFVLSFDKGYGTHVGTGGRKLSAGERQRVALARAIYGNPPLIVLDEPNSNLDAEGDQALTNAIKTMRTNGSTVIVVAHRPSAINAVDKLLFLRNGRQVAFGPKEEVLKQVIRTVPSASLDIASQGGVQAMRPGS